MKEYKIKHTSSGNCGCIFCGKTQPGLKLQPYTVWWKEDTEARGHNEPACSIECCKAYIEKESHGR